MRNFTELRNARWAQGFLSCVGLDSDLAKVRQVSHFKNWHGDPEDVLFQFNRAIIEATADIAGAFKLNAAFYEAQGTSGWKALQRSIKFLLDNFSAVPVILDAKRADIGNTNLGYVTMAFEYLGADAVTVNPYFGQEALQPFLERKEKGVIVLCRTSNPGAGEFQDLRIGDVGAMLYEYVAHRVSVYWNKNGNCMLVVGATVPSELQRVRRTVGDMGILVPGVGAQGGDLKATIEASATVEGGLLINNSRGIIFASSEDDFADVARAKLLEMNSVIESCLAAAGRN